jgi:hypothetical protein
MSNPTGASSRAVRRLRLRETSCPDCEHPWEEHGRPAFEGPAACGECQYEEDHAQQVPGREKCWNSVPPAVFVGPTARELERAAPLRREALLRFGQLTMAVLHLVVRRP